MIYFTDKDGNIIGKNSPTAEQKKMYLKSGLKECDEDGKIIKKAKKAKKK
jgi:hypothetical protein